MTATGPRGPVVIDTSVYGAELHRPSPLAELYRPILQARPAVISFQTVAELHYGARRRAWGRRRMQELGERIDRAEIVWAGPDLLDEYVDLRVRCERVGHALAQRDHDADRWIAATAVWLGIPSPTTGSSATRPGSSSKLPSAPNSRRQWRFGVGPEQRRLSVSAPG